MENFGLTFHHLGLAVTKPEKSVQFLGGIGYHIQESIYDPLQNVNLIMCTAKHAPDIEIVYPHTSPSVIHTLLNKKGEGLYHSCYTTESLQKTLDVFRQQAIRIMTIQAPLPALLFENRQVSFYLVQGFGMIEILEI